MARTFIENDFRAVQLFHSEYDGWVVSIRDSLRTALDGDNLHTNWLVTDIAKWEGLPGYEGYAFAVWHMSSSVRTGPAWLFILTGKHTSTELGAAASLNQILDNTVLNSNFSTLSGGNLSSSDGALLIHYVEDGSTTNSWDIPWDSVGALGGGDLSAPTTNPYNDFATFLPDPPTLAGFYFAIGSTSGDSKFVTLFDDTKPFLAVYAKEGSLAFASHLYLGGALVEPYLSTDSNRHAVAGWIQSLSISSITTSGPIVRTYDASGTPGNSSLDYQIQFGLSNTPVTGGSYPWTPVSVYDADYIKGYFDSDILRVMGPVDYMYAQLFDGGNFIKYHQHLCFPYVAGEPIFPGG